MIIFVFKSHHLWGAPGEGILTGSEDCLYLDIRTPKNKSSKLLPVMFWIHGGGNTSGLKDLYDYSTMVDRHDVIVVTINYRLGAFGWFTHPSIQGNQVGLDKTSNFGTLDIIQALKWVNKNIELFGGDPSNITIFGESAGGHNVLSLMVSPQAKGLFHKSHFPVWIHYFSINRTGFCDRKTHQHSNIQATRSLKGFLIITRIYLQKIFLKSCEGFQLKNSLVNILTHQILRCLF